MPGPRKLEPINPRNDWTGEKHITQKNPTTRAIEDATGLSGLLAWLSLTSEGATIDASLSGAVTEANGARYFRVFQGTDLLAHLPIGTFDKTVIYLVFGDSVNIFTSDPVKVVYPRRSD